MCLPNLILKAASRLTDKQLANIDATDANNELVVVDYIDEVYKFYKLAEVCHNFLSLLKM